MKYSNEKFLVLVLISVLLFSCSKTECKILADNILAEENLLNIDLNGFSVNVSKDGINLDNIYNGKVILEKELSAGTIYITNCHNIDIEIFSNAFIILDDKSEINNFLVHDNARISFPRNAAGKKNTTGPTVETLVIDYGKRPVIDGCRISAVRILEQKKENILTEIPLSPAIEETKPTPVITKVEKTDATESVIKEPVVNETPIVKKLTLTQDKTYDGNGVRIHIENRPEDAEVLNIMRSYKNKTSQVTYLNALYNKDFFSDFYTYEYAQAGEESRFIFNYTKQDKVKNQTVVVASETITVIPEKGEEAYVNAKNAELKIDEDTMNVKWITKPETNLPKNAELVFNVWTSQDGWMKLGEYKIRLGSIFCYDDFNLYTDPGYYNLRHFKNDRIFLTVAYSYNGCSWDVLTTDSVKVDPAKFK